MTTKMYNYAQTRWSLDDLFPSESSPELQNAFTALDERVAAYESNRSLLTPDIPTATLMSLIEEIQSLYEQGNRLYAYANLWFTEDTQNQDAQSLIGRVQQFFAGLQNRVLFFSLWWKDLDDDNAARLMTDAGAYRYWLQEMRNFKPHTLTEAEEKIVNIKETTGSSALNMLYDTITNRYSFKLEIDGETKELTRGQLMANVYSPDPDLRARAYQELYRVFGDDAPILGQIYQYLARDWRNENVDLRKFSTPLSVRNLANDIPDQAVEALLDVCRQNAPVFQHFFKLKARWLGMEKLRRYDIYAPVVASEKKYPYEQSVSMVMDAFLEFHPRFAELAEQVFAANHIDSEIRKGKADGAFCAYPTPALTPWVQLNYMDRARDVTVMAHELGHAIHGLMANKNPLLIFSSSLPLAETASTFAEMVLIDRLLELETDEKVRQDILFAQVDDAYATIMRQAWFAMFEKQAHEMVAQDANVKTLSEAYFENLKGQFGDAVEIADEFRHEWVSIPHIFGVPFYVYAYAFGQLLVLALYKRYKAEGDAFIPKLFSILEAGGSASAQDILSGVGIDITSASFWQGGFEVIAGMIEQLEALPIPA